MATVTVDISKYVASNGKEPRGYGCWWFEILNWQYRYSAHYGKAVAEARQEARRLGKQFGISNPPVIVLMP